jgi:hypothetical protein
MKTVTETIYFDVCKDIEKFIDELVNVLKNAKSDGMIEGTGKLHNNYECNEIAFEFKRPETEKERLRREKCETAALKKAADAKKAVEDKDRAEYERLKAKFEGAK